MTYLGHLAIKTLTKSKNYPALEVGLQVDRIICNVTSFITEAKIIPINVNGDIGSKAVSKRR